MFSVGGSNLKKSKISISELHIHFITIDLEVVMFLLFSTQKFFSSRILLTQAGRTCFSLAN